MKNKSMRTSFIRLSLMVVLLFFILVISINVGLQFHVEHLNQKESTVEVFGQLEQLIEANEKSIEVEKLEFKDRCLRAANFVSKYVGQNPEIIMDEQQIQELADTFNVDEIHFINEEGVIYSGNNPLYYGLSFESNDDTSFFKPMLNDKSLQLYQDANLDYENGKVMHYAAVWLEDGSSIVQIGLEPVRIIQQIRENSIERILTTLPFKVSGDIHVINRNTKDVVASTNAKLIGSNLNKEEFDRYKDNHEMKLYHVDFEGVKYCVYSKIYDDYIFVRSYISKYLVNDLLGSTLLIFCYYGIGSVGIIFAIRWYIKKYFTDNLNKIIAGVKKIDEGNMSAINLDTGISEFDELLFYINHMLNSIRLNWNKLSYVMDKGGIPIGILEENIFYKKTFINERIIDIFEVFGLGDLTLEEQTVLVSERMQKTLENMVDEAEHIYRFTNKNTVKYLRIEKVEDGQCVVYYVTDLTMWWDELNLIKEQSIIDELTKLYNRRGFHEKMNSYFENIKTDEYAAVIMIDTDNLKRVNDHAGHHIGDEYLINISKVLRNVAKNNSICARLGGDEFVVFLYGYKTVEDLEKSISCISLARGTEFDSIQGNVKVTLEYSMGVAMYPLEGKDFHVLMRIADEKMYQDKKKRKNSR